MLTEDAQNLPDEDKIILNIVQSTDYSEQFSLTDESGPLDIGDKCTSIANSSFSGYRIDLTLIVRATTPPTLSGTFLLGSKGTVLSIRVPAESVDAYKSAPNWSNYAPIISAI